MDLLTEGLTYEYGSLLAAGASIVQSQYIHQQELEKARERHLKEVQLAKEQHTKSLVEAKRSYLLEIFYDLEQHFQQLNADLISSGNESERDMFDQRNQNFQTIILASSVMFSGLTTAIVEGSLPQSASEWLVIAFSFTTSLSFFFLFICIVISIELVIRSSNFMYRRARKHANNLKKAIRETKELMHELNEVSTEGSSGRSYGANNNGVSTRLSDEEEEAAPSVRDVAGAISVIKKRIVDMDCTRLEEEWKKHEGIIQKFLVKREFVNDRIAVVDHHCDSTGTQIKLSSKMSFQEFWRTSCRAWERLAILFFYLGTLNLLLSIMVFMWAFFASSDQYNNLPAAIISVVCIGAALVLGSAMIFYLRYQSFKQHRVRAATESEPVGLVSVPTSTSISSSSLWDGDVNYCSCCLGNV